MWTPTLTVQHSGAGSGDVGAGVLARGHEVRRADLASCLWWHWVALPEQSQKAHSGSVDKGELTNPAATQAQICIICERLGL